MIKRLFFLFVMLAAAPAASAQEVGLVLSGGGAKGLYHIGVIKALEENDIPIDCIAGTSMGAIVGGLYAAGYSPAEMEEIFTSGKVNNWVTGQIDSRYNYYFKQMHRSATMLSLNIDFRGGKPKAHMPLNLIPSDQLDMAFIEFFAGAGAVCGGDFSQLLVPFRCVATDAVNQNEVVFRDGDLGLAIRASMSIPFVYQPIRVDSALLYDGGMLNNFPWQTLQEDFAPDIFIGSNSASSARSDQEVKFIDQAFMVTMLQTKYVLPNESDILIGRKFDTSESMSFNKAADMIAAGYDDTMASMAAIKERIARRADTAALERRRAEFRASIPPLRIGEIEIAGLTKAQENYVRKLLRIERDGLPIGFDKFRSEYFKILAEGQMEGDYPKVQYDPQSGTFRLKITMTTKPSFKVMFGGNLSSTALNQAYVGLEYKKIGYSARSYNLDGYFSAFHTAVSLAGRIDFFLRSPFYAEYGGQFNFYNYFRSNYGFLQKGDDVNYSKYRDHYATAAVGMPASRHSVLNLRVNAGQDEYLYYQTAGADDDEPMDRTKLKFVGAKLEFERNNFNYKLYPTGGVYQSASAIYVNSQERFFPGVDEGAASGDGGRVKRHHEWWGVKVKREQYFSKWARWFSLGYMAEGVATSRKSFSNQYATNISSPAFQPTPHSRIVYMKEFRSNTYVAAGLMPTFHFGPNFYLKTSGYLFLPDNLDGVYDNVKQRLRYIFDASLVYQTMLGPVSLAVSQYDTRSNNWFITFNFGYALFNPRGTFY
ncbi:patatin-like phospholipase family protein [Alistipes sp. OttesenSCG-928-B03]|nr:patatin-like phospholipase family protein [Alistipes sp. OttesenSCG-928-B03]